MAKLVNKHIRITEQQDQHLLSLKLRQEYNVNELIRKILDNVDDVTRQLALSRQQQLLIVKCSCLLVENILWIHYHEHKYLIILTRLHTMLISIPITI